MISGRVRTRFSLHPSSAEPPKSSGPKACCWSMVPMAPSRTRMRSSSAFSRSAVVSLGTAIEEGKASSRADSRQISSYRRTHHHTRRKARNSPVPTPGNGSEPLKSYQTPSSCIGGQSEVPTSGYWVPTCWLEDVLPNLSWLFRVLLGHR